MGNLQIITKSTKFRSIPTTYSGDTRSPFPVISVHFLFYIFMTGGKINTFFIKLSPFL